jgi:hypothetical protein
MQARRGKLCAKVASRLEVEDGKKGSEIETEVRAALCLLVDLFRVNQCHARNPLRLWWFRAKGKGVRGCCHFSDSKVHIFKKETASLIHGPIKKVAVPSRH